MKKNSNKKLTQKEQKNLYFANTLKTEFHFLKYPFFDLCPRISKKDKIEIRKIERTKEGEVEILWKVIRGLDYNFPASFARRIHKEVVEKTLNSMKKPTPRLIKLGSLRKICKKMDIAEAGKNLKDIKKALRDIIGTTIEAKGTFRQKEKNGPKKFFEGIFHLYDGVFFTGETLPDNTEADAVYILLNAMYIQNINNNFVVPIDYEYFQSLKGEISSRMYEILSVWLYPAFENGKKYIEKKYSELCDYFPLIRQDKKWKAKKQLKLSHKQHVSSGFLKREPEWKDIRKKDDWLIQYYIGPRAEEWYYSIKKGRQLIEISEQKQIAEPIEEKTEEKSLLSKLLSLKIPQKKAEYLIKNCDNIEDWWDALNLIKPKNKAGFLVKALEEKWELPEELRKKKAARDRKKEEELMSQYYESIFKQVDEHLCQMDKNLVQEELKQHREIFLNKYPTYREFEKSIFLNPSIEQDYKKKKIEELGLLSFAQWKEQRI